MVQPCCVCSGEGDCDENPLVDCHGQGCNIVVHQDCYGIESVPSGQWFCRKCEEMPLTSVTCELCPSREGAFKKTNAKGWAHLICALYIPEVRFDNETMDKIIIPAVPGDLFSRSCYICEDTGRATEAAVGACMPCNKQGCNLTFHVTCAQTMGLLCNESTGIIMNDVDYCGYCHHHHSELETTSNRKMIPSFRPVHSGPLSAEAAMSKAVEQNTEEAEVEVIVWDKDQILSDIKGLFSHYEMEKAVMQKEIKEKDSALQLLRIENQNLQKVIQERNELVRKLELQIACAQGFFSGSWSTVTMEDGHGNDFKVSFVTPPNAASRRLHDSSSSGFVTSKRKLDNKSEAKGKRQKKNP